MSDVDALREDAEWIASQLETSTDGDTARELHAARTIRGLLGLLRELRVARTIVALVEPLLHHCDNCNGKGIEEWVSFRRRSGTMTTWTAPCPVCGDLIAALGATSTEKG